MKLLCYESQKILKADRNFPMCLALLFSIVCGAEVKNLKKQAEKKVNDFI